MKCFWLFALAFCIVPSTLLFCQDTPPPETYNGDPLCHNVRGGFPHATYRPAAGYDDKDRKAKVQGTVTLSTIITKEGRTDDIKVTKSLTPGLDKKAIEAVSQWKFDPMMQDGKACPMRIAVEVQFRLY